MAGGMGTGAAATTRQGEPIPEQKNQRKFRCWQASDHPPVISLSLLLRHPPPPPPPPPLSR
eukprot:2477740-Pyramimonas_sp.AAC.1